MKRILMVVMLSQTIMALLAQSTSDKPDNGVPAANADDPSQFITRSELYNEIQHFNSDVYINVTTLRTIFKIGKRFTTRLDIPFGYSSLSTPANYSQFGLSDISLRLLGYRILERKKMVLTASLEFGLNTARSPLLGTGKNIVVPVVTVSKVFNKNRMIAALVLQQANSFSGDEERQDISFSKIQPILLNFWSKKMWTVIAPEMFIDYMNGGAVSMNLEGRIAFAPRPRVNIWASGGIGLFGNFIARYQWSSDIGLRYFFLRNTLLKRNNQ